MSKPSGFSVPNWFVTIAKFSVPALLVFGAMYVRQEIMQKDIDLLQSDVRLIKNVNDARSESFIALSQRLQTVEITQASDGKQISDSLGRIESTVKDMQTDIRDLNRRMDAKR